MPIDTESAGTDWQSGAKAKVEKLIRNFKARTDKIARATSDEAQKAYIAGVTDPVSQKLRVQRLKELSDTDLDNAMESKGRVSFPAGVDAGVEKYKRHVGPYFREIDAILPKLKARSRDARANVMERVIPIAVGLQNKKKALAPK